MPTFRHGKSTVLKLGTAGTPGTVVDRSDGLDNVTFPREVDTAETSTFGSTAKTYVVGLTNATMSFTGKFDATYDAAFSGIVGLDTPVSFEYGPEGSVTGRVKYSGTLILTSYETSGAIGDVVGVSAQAQITGPVTRSSY